MKDMKDMTQRVESLFKSLNGKFGYIHNDLIRVTKSCERSVVLLKHSPFHGLEFFDTLRYYKSVPSDVKALMQSHKDSIKSKTYLTNEEWDIYNKFVEDYKNILVKCGQILNAESIKTIIIEENSYTLKTENSTVTIEILEKHPHGDTFKFLKI